MLPGTSFLAIFVFSFAVGFGAVVSPGPVATSIVSQAPRRGWQTGPLVSTGHAVMELAIVLLLVLGLGAGLAAPAIQTGIAVVGGLLLAWMGGSMVLDTWRGRIQLVRQDAGLPAVSNGRLVGIGILATASNPFWYAWWVTVAAVYLAQASAAGAGAVAAFFLGHISADFAWNTFLSAVAGSGKSWMTDRLYRSLIVLCGLFFIYLGATFLLKGMG